MAIKYSTTYELSSGKTVALKYAYDFSPGDYWTASATSITIDEITSETTGRAISIEALARYEGISFSEMWDYLHEYIIEKHY